MTKKIAIFMLFAISVFSLAACGSTAGGKNQKDIEKADEVAYKFIVAQVEGDDDLFKKILVDEAQNILEKGHHAHPGAKNEMGERYQIKRYTNKYEDGKLYYYLKFYQPNLSEMQYMNVLLVKDDGQWKSTKIRGIDSDEMKAGMGDEEPVTVHKFKDDSK
ncbi:hypothetical protein JNUCC24_19400 (plasmid) [Bacillus sp. JNUCC-24]|uniref:hypothetical protein n=1 Tax=Bacillus sp. JNUCC-24 TaxID=2842458 RepID=UPI001C0B8DDB|nr:hypothetical protein [Bacillus sp. JNUCC-24]QWS52497.1 hypothetical protein JNUCC24_19400 [Bacillus sp. JNUCC-24]